PNVSILRPARQPVALIIYEKSMTSYSSNNSSYLYSTKRPAYGCSGFLFINCCNNSSKAVIRFSY
ncbi:hypothetical protein Q0O65_07825, partial [Bacillus paranthracis]|uniref:hypothetical protein n=1 Tax=Bacillus paranthracis TaxID=2026186 RepID=UPI00264EC206